MHTPETQLRLVLHGSVILLIGLACGIPSVVEVSAGSGRMWQGAHAALLTLGVWLLATAAVLPLLSLASREAAGLRLSLLLMAYCFTFAVIVQAVTGTRALGPDPSPLKMLVFVGNIFAVLGAFLSASLIALGASNALRDSRQALTTFSSFEPAEPQP
jgi:hypothetical protein